MKFEKVSYEEFKKAILDLNVIDNANEDNIKEMYEGIKLPKRSTSASAGYDFFMPFACFINSGNSLVIPTGIRWIPDDESYVLMLFPRSGLGTKYRLQLNNTVGIVDADYFKANNEGHILVYLTNDSKNPRKLLYIEKEKGFMQGIITRYYKVDGDDETNTRTGGFGSTDKVSAPLVSKNSTHSSNTDVGFDHKFPKELNKNIMMKISNEEN